MQILPSAYKGIFTYGKLYLLERVNKYTSLSVGFEGALKPQNINEVFLMLKDHVLVILDPVLS